jgi:hypothetical protein
MKKALRPLRDAITYLIASSGTIIGYMLGAADWSSAAASRLIEYLRHA